MFERQIEVYFKLYDKNGDGFISVDDVNKLKESFPEETWIISEDKLMVRNIWFSDPLAPSKWAFLNFEESGLFSKFLSDKTYYNYLLFDKIVNFII